MISTYFFLAGIFLKRIIMKFDYTLKKYIKFIALTVIFITACIPSKDISFDKDQWKSDEKGCLGFREQMYLEVMAEKEQLLKRNNNQIQDLLGKPDFNELYKRNQKFYIYCITPSRDCNVSASIENLYLFVRFNAVGLSNEIFVQNQLSLE